MASLSFGVAVRDITPAYPAWLHGYANRTHPSDGVLEPISLRCLAVSDGGRTVLIFAIDMIGVHAHVCQRLYKLLEREVGIGTPNVMLTCTHTHFAPGLHDMRYNRPHAGIVGADPRFVADFEAKLVEAAKESLRNLQPGALEAVRIDTPQVLFNRRTVRADGTVETNFRYPADSQSYAVSPTDTELTALRVVDNLGVKAVLCNFGCHPVTGGPSQADDHYRISADYAFYLRQSIAASYGCPTLFTLGAAGDAVPMDRYGRSRQRIGGILGDSIVLAERRFTADGSTDLETDMIQVEAETILHPDHRRVESDYEETQVALVELCDDPSVDQTGQAYGEAAAGFAAKMNALFRSRLYRRDRFSIPVQFIKIGETVLVGLPFEVLSEFSLKMKARYPNSVLCSCTGGYQGYLPFAYEYDRGGYEATPASTHFVPGTAERLLETTLTKLASWEDK